MEIQRLEKDTPCPGNREDYVWSDQAADYSTLYHNKELGTCAFTHIGCWVLTAEATQKLLDERKENE